jgi:dTDP-glucose pyrophosphorylase
MARINLVLPSAGLGSRFSQTGETRPKPLISVFNLPMIMWVLLNFPLDSSDRVWIICQSKHELPSKLANFTCKLPFDLEFLEIDGITEGPASTVALVFDEIDDNEALIVANTDQYVFENLMEFTTKVREGKSDGQILTMRASSNAWSYVGRDSKGNINQVKEKVQISNEATVGIYGWSHASDAKASFANSFAGNLRTNNEFYVAPTYNFMIDQGLNVETIMVGDHGIAVHGLGTPADLNAFLRNPVAKRISISLYNKF